MRSRMIKPGFFQNEILSALPLDRRLTFIGLWILADREGRLEDRPRKIKSQLFAYEDWDIEGCLVDLAINGFINRYEVGDTKVIAIPKWAKHQHVHPRETPSVLPGGNDGEQEATPRYCQGNAMVVPSPSTTTSSSTSTSTSTTTFRDSQLVASELIKDEKTLVSRLLSTWMVAVGDNPVLQVKTKLSKEDESLILSYPDALPDYTALAPKAFAYVAGATWPQGGFTPQFLEVVKPHRIRQYAALLDREQASTHAQVPAGTMADLGPAEAPLPPAGVRTGSKEEIKREKEAWKAEVLGGRHA